uniref:Neur_chan_LBD domain-containing protein n=1 Tax=Syphacia muris TaxID=451379 RepID=A0A0N5AD95_9BILA
DCSYTSEANVEAANATDFSSITSVPHRRLTDYLLDPTRYNKRIRPARNHSKPTEVHIAMSLYQIIQSEREQYVKMNMWMIQSWVDELLGWDPKKFGGIKSIILPHDSLWIPDTYLYNSVVMSHDENERYMNIKLTTLHDNGKAGAQISFLYPAIYSVSCRLNVLYFPYDLQNCTLVIGSWTHDSLSLDYTADPRVNMQPFIDNGEWDVEDFTTTRHVKYQCCDIPWIILRAHLVIRRKPLYYLINLVIPTSIITLVAITGFFTPGSTDEERSEKINLGITTLLAMSILMLIVSDAMPTTSDFVPLIVWFYLAIMIIISIATLITTVILKIHKRRVTNKLPAQIYRRFMFGCIAPCVNLSAPPLLTALWNELDAFSKLNVKLYSLNIFIITNSLHEMRRRRQCALEWEYFATILDRIFLIIFSLIVIAATAALMLVGWMAHPRQAPLS